MDKLSSSARKKGVALFVSILMSFSLAVVAMASVGDHTSDRKIPSG